MSQVIKEFIELKKKLLQYFDMNAVAQCYGSQSLSIISELETFWKH